MIKSIEGHIIFPDRVQLGQLLIDGQRISKIRLERRDFRDADLKLTDDEIISPGFVDVQINGAFGKEFKTDIDAVEIVRRGVLQFGTTAICPTVTTRKLATYREHLSGLRQNSKQGAGAKVLGFHLEGPFLNPKKVGAQSADLLALPIDCKYGEYVSDDVSIVTLSPELEGAPELIRRLISDGKRVGVGHSLVAYRDLVKIFDPKDMMIVHAFNAMADLGARSPGVIGAALERDDYFVSLIADGIHVDPTVVRILWKAKRDKSKLFGITDGSAVLGLKPGIHKIGSRSIERRTDRAVLEGTETLVGSVLTLNVAARNIREFTGCEVNEAINAVSLYPARFLGRDNDIGQIKVGNAADFAIIDRNFEVQRTIIDGLVVWSRGDDRVAS